MRLGKNIYFTASLSLILGITIGVMSVGVAAKNGQQLLLPIKDLQTFNEVLNQIKLNYVDPIEDSQLLENAIQGMLSELDPHSAYLKPSDWQDLQENISGEFGGLGIEVTMEDGYVKVVSPIDDTPAQKAGVQAGDLIVKLGDKPVKGMSLGEAVELMRGKPKTDIRLTIFREGVNRPIEITVTRAIIKVESVKQKTLEPGYGYIRVSNFQLQTGKNIQDAYKQLTKDNPTLNGLVLDLRNNPGGVLEASVDVAGLFLDGEMVVYTKGREDDSKRELFAPKGDKSNGVPLIVLVNGGSASASEIVAGALQDHKRAIIMGTTTFGKGSVQTILPLSNQSALKLTIARYYTPLGRSIQAQGIVPDIEVEMATLTSVKESNEYIKEADLSRHLSNGNGGTEASTQEKLKAELQAKEGSASEKPLAETDYQLYQALNLLKSIKIVNSLKQ